MARALFHVQLNVRDFDRSVAFYKSLGFVEQTGFLPGPGFVPPSPSSRADLAAALGVDTAGISVTMLRFRDDPLMHLQLQGWSSRLVDNPVHGKMNALGVARICFLVDDLDAELALLKRLGLPLVASLEFKNLQWGDTRAAMFRDPDGILLEYTQVQSYTERNQ